MSQFQSTNSLQNSVFSWTFGKKKRFNDFKFKNQRLYDTSTSNKSNRYTSLGYGNKLDLMSKQGKGSPSPHNYNIRSCFEKNLSERKGIILAQKLKEIVNYFLINR